MNMSLALRDEPLDLPANPALARVLVISRSVIRVKSGLADVVLDYCFLHHVRGGVVDCVFEEVSQSVVQLTRGHLLRLSTAAAAVKHRPPTACGSQLPTAW